MVLQKVKNNCSWSKTEGNIICKGIEFFADRGGYTQQTGTHPVEEVKNSSQYDKGDSKGIMCHPYSE